LHYGKRLQKQKKTDETSTPNQTVAASSSSPIQAENNLQLALVQTPNVEHNPSSEPERRGATSAPIVEDDEEINEEDEQEEMQADLGALKHDPGMRIPIKRYAVNDQDRVRRRYIEMGP
jgi:hypothetical protein